MKQINLIVLALLLILLTGCGGGGGGTATTDTEINTLDIDIKSKTLLNHSAYVTSQCYTKTIDEHNQTHNPCYSCHRESIEPNYVNDESVQEINSFPAYATTNHWKNLFLDKRALVAKTTNSEIDTYIAQDNYKNSDGTIILANKLKNITSKWDVNNNAKWDGYTPDCHFNFDDEGFDKDLNGTLTGWRAFAYYPFLGTFWPTNGSTDDVIIRLPEMFQKDANGNFDKEVYKINLSIVESLTKKKDIEIAPTNEAQFNLDLDGDGVLGTASKIKYTYDASKAFSMSYVGLAKQALIDGTTNLAGGLFPTGTEFLHSVRYIDASTNPVGMAKRMKELRYSKKNTWLGYEKLAIIAAGVVKEKLFDPDALETFEGDAETGLTARGGWVYQGFIEDKDGELRPQSYEETLYCMGCHGGIGATTDTIFAFPRKFEKPNLNDGWYHWSKKGLVGIPEPKNSEGLFEYSNYLKNNGAGDEFRGNDEVFAKFFDAEGKLKDDEASKINQDISYLLLPTQDRARSLNKAYQITVKEQSFLYGRDTLLGPATNVNQQVTQNSSTQLSILK